MDTHENLLEAQIDEDTHRDKGYNHECHICHDWTIIETTQFHPTAKYPWTCENCQHVACEECNLIKVTKVSFRPKENKQLRMKLDLDLAHSKISWKCHDRRCRQSNELELNSLPVSLLIGPNGKTQSFILLDLAKEKCFRCGNFCGPQSRKTWIFVQRLFKQLPRSVDEIWQMEYFERQLQEELDELDLEHDVPQIEGDGRWY
ncbi:hypothetical protein RUND412_002618 [Rhizina undulata]